MVLVVAYDPTWPERFERLRAEYATALDAAGVAYLRIEHVGSTSVPDLSAKPIIDVDIVVDRANVAAASTVLEGLGFRALGELGIPDRWAFEEPERLIGTATYVIVDGSLALKNHRAFRDILRADPGLREQYAAVKQESAAKAADIFEYGRGKNALIQRILTMAGLTEAELQTIDNAQVPDGDEVPRRWIQTADSD